MERLWKMSRDRRISPASVRVWLYLLALSHRRSCSPRQTPFGEVQASVTQITKGMNMKNSITVWKSLNELRQAGHVEWESAWHVTGSTPPNIYRLFP